MCFHHSTYSFADGIPCWTLVFRLDWAPCHCSKWAKNNPVVSEETNQTLLALLLTFRKERSTSQSSY